MDLGMLRWSLYLYQHGLPWAFYCDQANDRIIATKIPEQELLVIFAH